MRGILTLVLLSFAGLSFSQSGHSLKVKVTNISSQKGTIRICLTNKKQDFTKACYLSKEVPAKGREATVEFTQVPVGTYAIAVYHDEDDNGILNKDGIFGSPSEAYGFSNNPRILFGPPGFEKCSFRVEKDRVVEIKL